LVTRIIVATLGERPSLKAALISIAKQKITDLEVKIVCPLQKIEKVQGIAQACLPSNFELIQDAGKGLSAAINQGYEAPGDFEYFCWLNDDDELTAGSLERSINSLDANPNFYAVVGTLGYVRKDKSKIVRNKVTNLNISITKIGPNIIPQPGSLVRRTSIGEARLLNEKYKYAMDLDMWLRIMEIGRIGIINETQAVMNWHQDSITVSNRKNASIEAFQIRLTNSQNLFRKFLVIICYLPTRLLSSILSKIN
jgi:glycosyltransferase involved in cell wall biosynthesis